LLNCKSNLVGNRRVTLLRSHGARITSYRGGSTWGGGKGTRPRFLLVDLHDIGTFFLQACLYFRVNHLLSKRRNLVNGALQGDPRDVRWVTVNDAPIRETSGKLLVDGSNQPAFPGVLQRRVHFLRGEVHGRARLSERLGEDFAALGNHLLKAGVLRLGAAANILVECLLLLSAERLDLFVQGAFPVSEILQVDGRG
jgi:hypothetical protein